MYKSYCFHFFPHFSLWCIDHERRIERKSCSKKIIKNALNRIWTGDILFTSQASYHRRLICVFWNKGRQSILNKAIITCTLESSVENGWLSPVNTKYMLHVYSLLIIQHFTKIYMFWIKGRQSSFNTNGVICSYYFRKWIAFPCYKQMVRLLLISLYFTKIYVFWNIRRNPFSIKIGVVGEGVGAEGDLQLLLKRSLSGEWVSFPCLKTHSIVSTIWAPSSEFVSSSIPSWQILTAHAQPFRGARDLVFCLKVPLDSLFVWASSGGSGETARMRRLAWTFAARIGYKYQTRLARPIWYLWWFGAL